MSYHWGGPLAAAGVFGASQLLQQSVAAVAAALMQALAAAGVFGASQLSQQSVAAVAAQWGT